MKKILIIDFDQKSLQELTAFLGGHGFQVVTASDGQAGWDAYREQNPDLVLLEPMLSKIHGFDLCQKIAADSRRKTPVFIITAIYKDRVYRLEATKTFGASRYFDKPLDKDKLLEEIKLALKLEAETAPRRETAPASRPAEEKRIYGLDFEELVLSESTRTPTATRPAVSTPSAASAQTRAASPAAPVVPAATAAKSPAPAPSAAKPATRPSPDPLTFAAPKTRTAAAAGREPVFEGPSRPIEELLAAETPKKDKPAASVKGAADAAPKNGDRFGDEEVDALLMSALKGIDLPLDKGKTHEKPAQQAAKTAVLDEAKTADGPAVPPAMKAQEKAPASKAQVSAVTGAPPETRLHHKTASVEDVLMEVEGLVKPSAHRAQSSAATQPAAPAPAPPTAARPLKREAPAVEPAAPIRKAGREDILSRAWTEPEPEVSAPVSSAPVRQKAGVKRELDEVAVHKAVDYAASAPGDIFSQTFAESEKKKFNPMIAVGVGVAVVALAAFLIFKPKHETPPASLNNSVQEQATVQTEPPAATAEEQKPAQTALKQPAANKAASENKPTARVVSRTEQAAPDLEPQPVVPTLQLLAPTGDAAKQAESGQTSSNAVSNETLAGGEAQKVEVSRTEEAKTEANTEVKAEEQTAGQEGKQEEKKEEAVASPPADAAEKARAEQPEAKRVLPGDLVDISEVDELPVVQKSYKPVYPEVARRFNVEGSITVNALINEFGDVIDAAVIKGIKDDKGLGKAAEASVKKWKFRPAYINGVPVKVWKPVVVVFKLGET